MSMCTCAVHCTLNYCHEKACCDGPPCQCWCHKKDKRPFSTNYMGMGDLDVSIKMVEMTNCLFHGTYYKVGGTCPICVEEEKE
jgi:hypothetical protein